ncbi:hypothetical protein QBC37DRAFT_367762 [Rhypophila decipiens]|uniref:Glycerophosphocholine acyltransferase 1 n=1 Tax=Rhypophila decipiens TaxID=261697 RepID=A0AAN6YI04_9PEZI|nr:hypothetical protein QBC37DRAFT_367762 [Rhypophila decipiens]
MGDTEPNHKSEGASTDSEAIMTPDASGSPSSTTTVDRTLADSAVDNAAETPTLGPADPKSSPRLSRTCSFSGSSSFQEDWEAFPPLDRLSVLDLLDNFALPQQLEKLQKGISAQTEKVRKSREALKNKSHMARERMVDEWRRRVPSAEEQLDRYRKRMRTSVEKLGTRWNDTKSITLREKISFICGVMNIFMSGYLIGGHADIFHIWYTAQILYFMPIRWYTYHKRGYHYFLADLCYFVNFLLLLSIWVFPGSKRLFTAVFCLAFGNNAVAIIMWRNSLVFHSFDKVTSLFIHIMPCATLHCIVHLLDPAVQKERFPAIWTIKTSPPGSPTHYANMMSMLAWSTIPYAIWQLGYYFFITVRRRDKIAAGRPTSFTWLLKSYSKVWIGRIVLSLPGPLQEPAFMFIQYAYAVLTMLPCPLWFTYRWLSGIFLLSVFAWSVYNGSTYYIDVFGKRFQKELEAMKAEVTKWQNSPVAGDFTAGNSPVLEGNSSKSELVEEGKNTVSVADAVLSGQEEEHDEEVASSYAGSSVDNIPLLNDESGDDNVVEDGGARDVVGAVASGSSGERSIGDSRRRKLPVQPVFQES